MSKNFKLYKFTIVLATRGVTTILTVERKLWPLPYILCAANISYKIALVATGGNKFCSIENFTVWMKIMMGFQLVLCTCDLFVSMVKSSFVPRPPIFFVCQLTGTGTMQSWQRWHVTNKKLDEGLGTRLILMVKDTVLGYFVDRLPKICWLHFDCGHSCDYRAYNNDSKNILQKLTRSSPNTRLCGNTNPWSVEVTGIQELTWM